MILVFVAHHSWILTIHGSNDYANIKRFLLFYHLYLTTTSLSRLWFPRPIYVIVAKSRHLLSSDLVSDDSFKS